MPQCKCGGQRMGLSFDHVGPGTELSNQAWWQVPLPTGHLPDPK